MVARASAVKPMVRSMKRTLGAVQLEVRCMDLLVALHKLPWALSGSAALAAAALPSSAVLVAATMQAVASGLVLVKVWTV